mgnify:CR=1 FL=1|tara:strand:+ start:830 stop:1546 length:717 start_codon:yes stop_codon:yes gene_type:complete
MGLRDLHSFNIEYASAFGVLKILSNLLKRKKLVTPFSYIAHFGCKEGTWLAAAKDLGASRVVGIDSPNSFDMPSCLDKEEFHGLDLSKVKVVLPHKADLAICVEFAHELSQNRGNELVSEMCSSAKLVLFSSGTPFQGNNPEFNFQWHSYWAKKFFNEGFLPDFKLRNYLWSCKSINPVYRQNCILFFKPKKMPKKQPDFYKLDVVHPSIYESSQARQEALAKQLTNSTLRKIIKKKN